MISEKKLTKSTLKFDDFRTNEHVRVLPIYLKRAEEEHRRRIGKVGIINSLGATFIRVQFPDERYSFGFFYPYELEKH